MVRKRIVSVIYFLDVPCSPPKLGFQVRDGEDGALFYGTVMQQIPTEQFPHSLSK